MSTETLGQMRDPVDWNPERRKGAVPVPPGPQVLAHEAKGPPDMSRVSMYTAGSSPKAGGEFWFPFKAPLPRCTAANQGARIVAEPQVATASDGPPERGRPRRWCGASPSRCLGRTRTGLPGCSTER